MHLAKWMKTATVVAVMCCSAAFAYSQSLDAPSGSVGAVNNVGIWVHVQSGPSGTPGGFTVEWIKKSKYVALGGWPAAGDPTLWWCSFNGTPTRHPSTGSFLLAANGSVDIEMGDIFDETDVTANYYAELPSGTEIVFRVRADPGAGQDGSAYSADVFATTTSIPSDNCTYTQGYWKTHASAWPVTSLTLGSVTYSQAQLLSILNTPAHGNGLLILAHQLIASKLNFAAGADPTPVSAAAAAADAMIGGLVIPPVGAGYLAPASVNATANTLDDYNNGTLGVPHCGAVAVEPESWGALKAAFR